MAIALTSSSSLVACARFGYELADLDPYVAGGGGVGGVSDTDQPRSSGGGVGGGAGGVGGTAVGPSGGASGADPADSGTGMLDGGSGLGETGGGDPVDSGSGAADGGGFVPGTCFDGERNQDEQAVDCGGADCVPCYCTYAAPELLASPNIAGSSVFSPSSSADGLIIMTAALVAPNPEGLYIATRASVGDPFSAPVRLPPPMNDTQEGTPFLLPDGLTAYFFSSRAGGAGSRDLYRATRASRSDDFGDLTALSSVNSDQMDHIPWVSADELDLYFASLGRGSVGTDLWHSSRNSSGDAFNAPTALSELNTDLQDDGMTLSQDQRLALFTSDRPGGEGLRDIYRTRRASVADPFSTPERVPALNSADEEHDPHVTFDGRELYLVSRRNGGTARVYRSRRTCP